MNDGAVQKSAHEPSPSNFDVAAHGRDLAAPSVRKQCPVPDEPYPPLAQHEPVGGKAVVAE